ncbi:MAG TPA: pyrroline-5-carboxylate reductase [Acidimicrobiales bacterium]
MTGRGNADAMKLELVGGGRMGEALLAGLLAAGWAEPHEMGVVERLPARRAALEAQFPGVRVLTDPATTSGAVIAVKPADVEAVCAAVSDAGCERVVSIAAGVPLAKLQAALGPGIPVVRAMPNTPALVGAGAAAIAAGADATDDDMAWAESILGAVGAVVRLPERLLDAVTGLSGSGPAYVFLVAEALIEAGVLAGLPRDVSVALSVQTLLGAARLLVETGDTPETLRAMVTSPGGTTAEGLRVLESAGVRAAFLEAVVAATRRSKELGAT